MESVLGMGTDDTSRGLPHMECEFRDGGGESDVSCLNHNWM